MNWVKQARQKLGLKQCDFAALLGVTQVTVSRWEQGHRTPSLKVLIQVAELLNEAPGVVLDFGGKL